MRRIERQKARGRVKFIRIGRSVGLTHISHDSFPMEEYITVHHVIVGKSHEDDRVVGYNIVKEMRNMRDISAAIAASSSPSSSSTVRDLH